MTREGITSKLARFRGNLEALDLIPRGSREEFLSDGRNLWAAIYLLQTSIQALIDVGSYVAAGLGLAVPSKSQDLLDSLESAGHLPAGSASRFSPMFAFRNRVVHLYERIDPERVYSILTEHRGEMEDLMAQLLDLLEPPAPGAE